jgi:ATP-dependent DNA ligase
MIVIMANVTGTMLYAFSLPTKADHVPAGPDWLHEVKYDGYRMMVIREQDCVRLISRGGDDRTRYFPLIVAVALKLRQEHFVIADAGCRGNNRDRCQSTDGACQGARCDLRSIC